MFSIITLLTIFMLLQKMLFHQTLQLLLKNCWWKLINKLNFLLLCIETIVNNNILLSPSSFSAFSFTVRKFWKKKHSMLHSIWKNFLYWFFTAILPVFWITHCIVRCFRVKGNVHNVLTENYSYLLCFLIIYFFT